MLKSLVRAGVLVAFLAALSAPAYVGVGSVSAHVHGVTPLNDCSVDNAEHSGGRVILDTPAAAENDGPIQPGPVPVNTGNAAFDPETGGGNHGDPRCP